MNKERHYEESVVISASPKLVFEYTDDHKLFSSHMNKPSLMMGGGLMKTTTDNDNFQKVGSHLQMGGKILGINLFLDEEVTRREPPSLKTWATVGVPRLLVVGNYGMGIEIKPEGSGSNLKVYIDYDLPSKNRWLGELFGKTYAVWCVQQMINGASDYFSGLNDRR